MVVGMKDQRKADELFHALADATRRNIVMRCLQGEYSVSALARFYPMSFAAVQKHVAVLENAELVTKRRRGREQLVRGNVHAVRYASGLLDQLEEVWRSRIDRMDEILTEDLKKEPSHDRDQRSQGPRSNDHDVHRRI
jgi:DNA-binding transcriptional ArsR family regulator